MATAYHIEPSSTKVCPAREKTNAEAASGLGKVLGVLTVVSIDL
jgi:hypothetical protein